MSQSAPQRKGPSPGRAIKSTFGMIGRFLITLIMVGIITGCIVACILTVYILRLVGADNSIDLNTVKMGYTSLIYATDPETGEDVLLKRLYYGGEDRTWVDYDDISEYAKQAIVAIEDKRFWSHDGVDWLRTGNAFLGMFGFGRGGSTSGGGSTLTQQLIKNVTGDDDVRVDRKVREIFRALDLHKNYSREEILEAYLNLVPLGSGTNGIQAAANHYFGKTAAELTLAESASIVGITQKPTKYNPLLNPEENKDRQEHVLYEMLDQELITQEEHDKAVDEKLIFRNQEVSASTVQPSSYFVDHVINEVISDLMSEKGMTYAYAIEQLYKGGYRVYTTVDLEMQAYLEEFFLTTEKFPAIYNEEYPQSATVVIDTNGKMLAVVGAIGEKVGERTFNMATMSRRHPGSAIKPIGAYVLAIEYGMITWSTIIEDSPLTNQPGGWSPDNYYVGFKGPVTVDEAVQRSINTVAAKVVDMLGPVRVFNFLKNDLHFEGLVEREVRGTQVFTDVAISPMALGALTYGVSPLEMAGAYQIFANGGMFTQPYSYTRIEDAEGNIVLEKDTAPRRVVGEDTAVVMNKLLQRVTGGPYGTGTHARLANMPTAGKTGTSQDDVNQWFIGLTPYYVAPAWLGYERTTRVVIDNSGRRSVVPNRISYGVYPPPVLWKTMMEPLHEGLEPIPFIDSPSVVSYTYCTQSGGIATNYCPTTNTGWYKKTRIPGNCSIHTTEVREAEQDDPDAPVFGSDDDSGSDADGDGGTRITGPSIFDNL